MQPQHTYSVWIKHYPNNEDYIPGTICNPISVPSPIKVG